MAPQASSQPRQFAVVARRASLVDPSLSRPADPRGRCHLRDGPRISRLRAAPPPASSRCLLRGPARSRISMPGASTRRGSWPQNQIGIVLWSLSASAHDWLPREKLTRLSATPVIGVLESQWDFGSSAMEVRILRPLLWFGLLESRTRARSATELVDPRL